MTVIPATPFCHDPIVPSDPVERSFDDASNDTAPPDIAPPDNVSQRADPIWLWQGSRLVAHAVSLGSRMWGETCGASALEYTVILALIIGSLYLGVEFLARPAAASFARVADIHSRGGIGTEQTSTVAATTGTIRPGSWLTEPGVMHAFFAGFVFILSVVLLAAMIWRHWTMPADIDEADEETEETDARQHVFDKRQKIARTLSVHLHELLEHGMTVGHVMSKLLSPVHVNTPRVEVERTMAELHIRHLLVVDSEGLLCGIISDRDLTRRHGTTAGEMMTANPLSTTACSPLNPAITLLIQRQISCLPVIDEGKPIGVFTSTDVMMTLQCMCHEMHKLGERERKTQIKKPIVPSTTPPQPTLA